MGTRGLLGFVADGELKASYNHNDSYPAGLGADVLTFVAQLVKDGPAAIASAKERVKALRVVENEGTEPTDEDVAALHPWTNESVGRPTDSGKPSWYQLLRETQGNADAILSSGYILDGRDFGKDSLFCEWAYVINFDTQCIEAYRGFQTTPPTKGLWVGQPPDAIVGGKKAERIGEVYYPIEQVHAFPFGDLPESWEFVATVERPSDSEE